ncbi:MAG: ATP-binding protein [Tannerella sp.]|jgi:hypothetical protein|nr:ATP-binding protein [Tannerella sp.]
MASDNRKAPLPIGHSFFDRVIEDEFYYVDKTLFIRDLLDKSALVTLCTRPRRFGKTLNQTMLKCFFEDTAQVGGKDTKALFKGLKIENAGERYLRHQGKYPVVFLSFKGAKRSTFEDSYFNLKYEIMEEFKRHHYVLDKLSNDGDREMFKKLAFGKGTLEEYAVSLRFLCKCLANYHNHKTVILIDEYDVPFESAWFGGFYQDMIQFIRPLFEAALKDNPFLQIAVITGCLRISKESIFTGLNNLDIISIRSVHYDEHFGFTQDEMDRMLQYYDLESKTQIVKDWYDGYLFGNKEVYNPWSSIRVINNWNVDRNCLPEPFWANTSSNDIVRKLIDRADSFMKEDLEKLMSGASISKKIHEDITYDEIDKNPKILWNFLFFTGYLKKIGEEKVNDMGEIILELTIPNIELKYIYKTKISEWFEERISAKNLDRFFNAILNGDTETFQAELSMLLAESISYMDSAENFYHGFMTGVLSRLDGYRIKSNRESGKGRNDLVMYALNCMAGKAVIFELKQAKSFREMPDACLSALKQIEDMDYAAEWSYEGYDNILKYGIAFYRKSCMIMSNTK